MDGDCMTSCRGTPVARQRPLPAAGRWAKLGKSLRPPGVLVSPVPLRALPWGPRGQPPSLRPRSPRATPPPPLPGPACRAACPSCCLARKEEALGFSSQGLRITTRQSYSKLVGKYETLMGLVERVGGCGPQRPKMPVLDFLSDSCRSCSTSLISSLLGRCGITTLTWTRWSPRMDELPRRGTPRLAISKVVSG